MALKAYIWAQEDNVQGYLLKGDLFKGIAGIGLAMMDFVVRQFAMQCQSLRDKIERAGPQSAYPQ